MRSNAGDGAVQVQAQSQTSGHIPRGIHTHRLLRQSVKRRQSHQKRVQSITGINTHGKNQDRDTPHRCITQGKTRHAPQQQEAGFGYLDFFSQYCTQ